MTTVEIKTLECNDAGSHWGTNVYHYMLMLHECLRICIWEQKKEKKNNLKKKQKEKKQEEHKAQTIHSCHTYRTSSGVISLT